MMALVSEELGGPENGHFVVPDIVGATLIVEHIHERVRSLIQKPAFPRTVENILNEPLKLLGRSNGESLELDKSDPYTAYLLSILANGVLLHGEVDPLAGFDHTVQGYDAVLEWGFHSTAEAIPPNHLGEKVKISDILHIGGVVLNYEPTALRVNGVAINFDPIEPFSVDSSVVGGAALL